MKLSRLSSLLGVWLGLSMSAFAMNVAALKCDYRIDPLGVDLPHPRLRWILESPERGDRQTAYQILAASTAALLDSDKGDLWDSSRIETDESVEIAYGGNALHSSQQVFWKVRVWDAHNQVSTWSATATWTMGFLAPTDWNAHWISAKGTERYAVNYPEAARHDFRDRAAFAQAHPNAIVKDGPNYNSLRARREFSAKPGLVRALVHTSGLGQYELSINGHKVGDDLLSPGWNNYRKTVLYDTHDITARLRTGANAIGLIMGNGMYNIQPDYVRYVKFLNSFGPLKVIAQVRLEYADGKVEIIGTDHSWQVAPGPVTYSNLYGGEGFRCASHRGRLGSAGFSFSKIVGCRD